MLSLAGHNRGETIIEVLIALSMLTLVLGLSYASASRSLRGSQEAHERTEASLYAESVIDTIRAYAEAGVPGVFPVSSRSMCISTRASDIQDSFQPPQPTTFPSFNPGNPACRHELYDRYTAEVEVRVSSSPSSFRHLLYEYAVIVRWDSLTSANTNQTVIRYKWVKDI